MQTVKMHQMKYLNTFAHHRRRHLLLLRYFLSLAKLENQTTFATLFSSTVKRNTFQHCKNANSFNSTLHLATTTRS